VHKLRQYILLGIGRSLSAIARSEGRAASVWLATAAVVVAVAQQPRPTMAVCFLRLAGSFSRFSPHAPRMHDATI